MEVPHSLRLGHLARCARVILPAIVALSALAQKAAATPSHVVIVIMENHAYSQIIGNPSAPYINNVLVLNGAVLTNSHAVEHPSQPNYLNLFSGDNQGVGFDDKVPQVKFTSNNLGAALIAKGLSFKGYSEGLPAIGSEIDVTPPGCHYPCRYGRKHVPWISFANVPNGPTVETSSNLRFARFSGRLQPAPDGRVRDPRPGARHA